VTQIFHNCEPNHSDDRKTFEVMISTYLRGTLGSVASLLAATFYFRFDGFVMNDITYVNDD